ncbi:hypothetical protein GpSGHVEth172 [Glossina pallidipes salivary gland hypertrophy virus]|uniref:Uncharacterized protein n=2 Tax=Glossina hytrovirus (isolate Glossina pallidipes/Ethiopia/Seibersdorf/-) TaxID=379529 RepID=B0YLW1_GHVS|nr:hypothetical protein SGHV157 [Glossina pallidipes salivary gland hypertrophy virus]ABQ08930.1 hypothetical protein SGHV157 [Glossina pallidipes salivary gland hypertrophy virus]AMB48776.1 hypothetical protein GpSGHVEth172 [Glossina pallidipes salivary gland hypertrophy virus]
MVKVWIKTIPPIVDINEIIKQHFDGQLTWNGRTRKIKLINNNLAENDIVENKLSTIIDDLIKGNDYYDEEYDNESS